MIKHLVFWRLKESAHGCDKATNARGIQSRLEALQGVIPGLLKIEVGIDFSRTENSADVALYSEFVDRAALDAYQKHPAHEAAKGFIGEATAERRIVDYADR